MIWNIFRTVVASVVVLSTQGFGAPDAKPCEMGERDAAEVSDDNFTVKLADQSDVLVLSVFQSSRTQWMTAAQLLSDEGADFYEAMQRVSQLYPKALGIGNVGSNVLYLTERLMTGTLDFVVLDLPYELVRELERLALSLYSEDMVYQVRYKKSRDDTMTRLVQLIVGAPVFVKTYNPQLFQNVQLIAGPSLKNRKANAALLPDDKPEIKTVRSSTENVQKKREELRDEFKKNAQTRQTFERFVGMIQSGRFDKSSDAEVREKVLARFWNPAKPKIRVWLDVELAARRNGAAAASAGTQVARANTKPPPPQPTEEKYSIAGTVLSTKGRGIVFVPRERFAALKAEIKQVCGRRNL